MKKEILSAIPFIPADPGAGISFRMFIDFIGGKINAAKGSRKHFYKYIHEKFLQYPELYQDVRLDKTGNYEELLLLIAHCVIPMLDDENERVWALGKTLSPHFFFGSDAFYGLLNQINASNVNEGEEDKEEERRLHTELQYSFILEKVYGIKSFFSNEWTRRMTNPETGLLEYYRISIDRRFAWIEVKGKLPAIEDCGLEECNGGAEALDRLKEHLPADLFEGKGFTIFTLTNVTPQMALEEIAKVPADDQDEAKAAQSMQHTNRLLQSLIGSNAHQFGIMPFLRINDRAAIFYNKFKFSIIADACWETGVSLHAFSAYINSLQGSPRLMTYQEDVENNVFPEDIQAALRKSGLKFYMSSPAYYNNQLVGILEVSSFEANPLNEQQMASLQPAMHLLPQLLEQSRNKFNQRMDAIVKDKFTNIQPSVQWKFNEAAWHYLRNNFFGKTTEPIESVSFTEVYPLYGAVDIRNSTVESNRALREDIKTHIDLLSEILAGPHPAEYEEEITILLQKCDDWLKEGLGFLHVQDEAAFVDFLRTHAHPLLESLRLSPEAEEAIRDYFDAANEQTGKAFENRRQLESSMKLINNAINVYYDEAKESLQAIYPCYFDKFRTDGVEYDLYTGQSLAPGLPFTRQHLRQFRFWQVHSMASIARMTHALMNQMTKPLQTTQLLLVHSKTIDIAFRNDERRFDVEGTYNIRYQVIKKRIDKIHLRGTDQRLTQPGKIAIVYSNREDAEEYAGYLHELQQQNILLDDIEYLELEELQGVTGLHALRVGVVI